MPDVIDIDSCRHLPFGWWRNLPVCQFCPHRWDRHDLNCVECCPVTRAKAAQTDSLTAQPRIVCLCGSTRFKFAFEQAIITESLQERIVLSVVCFSHADQLAWSPEQKAIFDKLHLAKIDLADEILVLNVGGYIGDSTAAKITYALSKAKTVRFLEPIDLNTAERPL